MDKTIYTFSHESGLVFKGNRTELKAAYPKYNWNSSSLTKLILGKIKTTLGWRVRESEPNKSIDHTIYTFTHKSGLVFQGNRMELKASYPNYNWDSGGLSAIILGKRKTHHGWSVEK